MFTVSDFISILRHFHRHALGHEQFARLNIEQWRGGRPPLLPSPLVARWR